MAAFYAVCIPSRLPLSWPESESAPVWTNLGQRGRIFNRRAAQCSWTRPLSHYWSLSEGAFGWRTATFQVLSGGVMEEGVRAYWHVCTPDQRFHSFSS